MHEVNVGIVGLGQIGTGTLTILAENSEQIAQKLGFHLRVRAVCSRSVASLSLPESLGSVFRSADWRDVVSHPDVDVVAELYGWKGVERESFDRAISHPKPSPSPTKELMVLCCAEAW